MSRFDDLLFGKSKPKRRKRQKILKGDLTKVMQRQKSKCALCGRKLTEHPKNYDIDHKKPLSEGGTNSIRNLQAICAICHKQKSDREKTKKARTRRKNKAKKADDPFGVAALFGTPSRRGRKKKTKSIWDI